MHLVSKACPQRGYYSHILHEYRGLTLYNTWTGIYLMAMFCSMIYIYESCGWESFWVGILICLSHILFGNVRWRLSSDPAMKVSHSNTACQTTTPSLLPRLQPLLCHWTISPTHGPSLAWRSSLHGLNVLLAGDWGWRYWEHSFAISWTYSGYWWIKSPMSVSDGYEAIVAFRGMKGSTS